MKARFVHRPDKHAIQHACLGNFPRITAGILDSPLKRLCERKDRQPIFEVRECKSKLAWPPGANVDNVTIAAADCYRCKWNAIIGNGIRARRKQSGANAVPQKFK